MKTFANWMTVIFMIMYWGFRVFITCMATQGKFYPVAPIDTATEIVTLFVTFVCIVLVFKRKRVGGFIYFGMNLMYYGWDIYSKITGGFATNTPDVDTGGVLPDLGMLDQGLNIFVSALGIILGIVVLIDVLSYNMKTKIDRSTDWFYTNKKLDKEIDSREDTNNYRLY